MSRSELFAPLVGLGIFPINFVIGFVLAKFVSTGKTRSEKVVGVICIFFVLQALLFSLGTLYFCLGLLSTGGGCRLLVPGLTGGLASGKTTVSTYLKNHGWTVIDADEIARGVLQRGTLSFHLVVRAFGRSIIDDATGEISRPRLREVVFQDATKRRALNKLTHPWIIARMFWQVFKFRICLWRRRVILDIPLLFETRLNLFCGPVVVVYVNDDLQFSRLRSRDRTCSEQTLRSMINSQLPLQEKALLADMVIDNNSSLENLFEQTRNHFPC